MKTIIVLIISLSFGLSYGGEYEDMIHRARSGIHDLYSGTRESGYQYPRYSMSDHLIRCKNGFVSPGDSVAVVYSSCGRPSYSRVISEDTWSEATIIRSRGRLETILESRRTSLTEKWAYDFGKDKFIKILTIQGDRVVFIETGPRRR